MSDHYLVLPDDQDGLRLGPLPDRVRIGSDASVCDVVLSSSLDAPGVAVELERDGAGWNLARPGATPHPCRIIRADGATRAARIDDRLRPGESLEITGTGKPARLSLVAAPAGGLPPMPTRRTEPALAKPVNPVVRSAAPTPAPGRSVVVSGPKAPSDR